MPEYRAYVIGRDGLFIDARFIVCDDDEAAKISARKLLNGHDVEVWLGDKRIAQFSKRDGT